MFFCPPEWEPKGESARDIGEMQEYAIRCQAAGEKMMNE